jgi:transglutaminase-like putative cysteine protease
LLLFLLLLQWLRPLPSLAGLDARVLVEPAALVLAGILLLDYLRFPGWLGWPMKMAFCLAWVGYMFSRHTMPDAQWFETYARTLLLDGMLAWGRHFAEVSAETRLLMFVLGWALMISVIHSLMLLRQHGLWFVLATLGYLLGLQLAADIETLGEMAYAAAIGLGLMLLLNLPRVERKFAVARKSPGWPFRWLALGSVLIAACVASGWWGSSAAREEVQPVDWSSLARWSDRYADKLAKSANAQGDTAGVAFALSGYGADDSRLGTPLVADDGVAFTALASRLAYWRGESKSYYDGQGWLSGEKGSVSAVSNATAAGPGSGAVGVSGAGPAVGQVVADGADVRSANGWPLVQEVMFSSHAAPGGMLFVGGPIERLDVLLGRSGTVIPANRLTVEKASGKYQVAGWQNPAQYYRAVVDLRSQARLLGMSGWEDAVAEGVGGENDAGMVGDSNDDAVMNEAGSVGRSSEVAKKSGDANDVASLSEADRVANLQLPGGLPGRVSDLAHRVAGAGKSSYEQAMLLESYLKTHYAYTLNGSRVPADGKDFVDDFLFRQMAGYCDHFSSAMVVMLRTLGIPARWVKGYAPGAVSDEVGDGSAEGDVVSGLQASSALVGPSAVSEDSGTSSTVSREMLADGSMGGSKPLHITVRNRDAHSWAEAWIDGVGWVAFEPTPGFAPAAGGGASVAAAQPAAVERGAALAQRLPAGAQALARAAGSAVAAARARAIAWRWGAAAALALALPLAWAAWRWRDELALQWALRGYRRSGGGLRGAMAAGDADGARPPHGEAVHRASAAVWRWSADAAPISAGAGSQHGSGVGTPADSPRVAGARPPASLAGGSAGEAARRAAAAPLLRVCERLWPRLRRRLGGQPPQQTLREFAAAQHVLAPSQRQALAAFAQLYEAARYGDELGRRISRRELATLWRGILQPAPQTSDPQPVARNNKALT